MTRNMYTTIDDLLNWESFRHLCYTVTDRTDSLITDTDVQEGLHEMCATASRDFDGYVRGHLDVPLEDILTTLSGTVALINGSQVLVGIGTSFDTELTAGDRVVLDDQPLAEVVIDSITDALNAVLRYEFYGEDAVGADASILTNEVPLELEILVRGHACYMLWNANTHKLPRKNVTRTGNENAFVETYTTPMSNM